MNIKSLLLGSAAALAVVSGAQAADAIVAAEPEPMEYVRVCDAFGTGYFYIPGTETCLKIGGYARFQVDFGRNANPTQADDWDAFSQAEISFDAKSDTELGILQGFVSMEANAKKDGTSSDFAIGQAYVALGGFKAGYFDGFFDPGLAGETDELADNAKFNSVSYTYASEAFVVGLAVDELYDDSVGQDHGLGVSGMIGTKVGVVSADFVVGYDTETSEAALRAIVSGDVGPGTLGVAVAYATGENVYWDTAEWTVAGSYSFAATEKLSITPGVQYWSDVGFVDGVDKWKYGVTVDYKPVDNLLARVSVQYDDLSEDVSGYFRLQRSF